jgi:hypothetical protein
MEGGNRIRPAALCDDVARAPFTPTALGGDTELELHFVKSHSCPRMAGNFTIRHSTAYANDHGSEGDSWLAVERRPL